MLQRRNRRRGEVLELVQGVEPGEMDRCIRAQFSLYPEAHFPYQRHLIILGWNDEVCDLQVDFLLPQRLQGVEHRVQFPAAQFTIKFARKPLQIDISRV